MSHAPLQILELSRIQWAKTVQAFLEIVELIEQYRQFVRFRKDLRKVEECGPHRIGDQGDNVCLILCAQLAPANERVRILRIVLAGV